MTEETFLSTHSTTWHQLEDCCLRIDQHGIKDLNSYEIKNFLNLFKLTSHHLAYAKTHYSGSQTIYYLNNLVSQCNTYVYTAPKTNLFHSIKNLFADYSSLLKKYKLYVLFAFSIFLLGSLISFLMVYLRPSFASIFLDTRMIDGISEQGSSGTAESWNYPLMSSYIMVNNITVALKAFVMGITLGIGTAYVLFNNGLILGSLTALFYLYGDPISYWSLILPHGMIELTAIFISGGAGFIIAQRFLMPGRLLRKYSLIKGAREALSLMGGVIALLIIAALIEGFFTPLPVSAAAKLLFALLTGILLMLYFIKPYQKAAKKIR